MPPCRCGQDHCWHEQPERGWVQFLILRIIYDEPTYGYKLMEALEGMGSGCHKLETGSVYTLLRRMERAGLLESEWERAETSGPSRRRGEETRPPSQHLLEADDIRLPNGVPPILEEGMSYVYRCHRRHH